MRLPDFEAWAIFASVLEHRSFSGAADAIGVSKATISKAVTRLERQLSTSLFHRTSRRLTLTDSGRRLADHANRILAEGLAADEAAADAALVPAGRVRLSAPMTFGVMHVAPVLAEFLAVHPAIIIDLHLSDAQVDIVAEGFDIALRIADLPDSSLRARRLGMMASRLVAAPSYLSAHGTPAAPSAIGEHRCLCYSNAPTWRFRHEDGREVSVRPAGSISANSGDALLPALFAGVGLALLPDFILGDAVAQGRVSVVLPEWSPPPMALHLLMPPGGHRPARVELLADFLTDRLRAMCEARG